MKKILSGTILTILREQRKGNSLPINTVVKLVATLIALALILWVTLSGNITKSPIVLSTLSDITGGLAG